MKTIPHIGCAAISVSATLLFVGCVAVDVPPDLLIRDGAGKPLVGARVVGNLSSSEDKISTSDRWGRAWIPRAASATKWISVCMEGFEPVDHIDVDQPKPIVITCSGARSREVLERLWPPQLSAEDRTAIQRLLGVAETQIQGIRVESSDTITLLRYGPNGMNWAGPLYRLQRRVEGWVIVGKGHWDGIEAGSSRPERDEIESGRNPAFPQEIPRPKF